MKKKRNSGKFTALLSDKSYIDYYRVLTKTGLLATIDGPCNYPGIFVVSCASLVISWCFVPSFLVVMIRIQKKVSLIRLSVSDGQKRYSLNGVTLIGIK